MRLKNMSDQTQIAPPQSPQVSLGVLLRERRLAKQTEIAELARTLILSAAQINAIETGSQASFHNQTFYLRALKKYIAHMDLALDAQASLLFTEIENKLLSGGTRINQNEVNLLIHAGLAHRGKSFLPQFNIKKSYLVVGLLALVLGTGLTVVLLKSGSEQPPAQVSDTPSHTMSPSKESTGDTQIQSQEQKSAPAKAQLTTGIPVQPTSNKSEEPSTDIKKPVPTSGAANGGTLKFVFSAPCWIQVIDKNGKRIEKVFTPKDALELDPSTLESLVIGNARETQLFSNSTEIDLSKYLNVGSGVARFSQSEIMKLSQ